ncbi:MAG: Gfo/Idh/MocA family protein [Frankia sp.]
MPRIHLVSNRPGAAALGEHLRGAGLGPTSARAADALLVLIDRPLDTVEQDLLDRARQSVPVLLAGPTLGALPADSPLVEATGLVPARTIPPYELRVATGLHGQEVGLRLDPDQRFVDSWVLVDKVADDVQRLLTVRYELAEQPICTWRPSTGLGVLTLGGSEDTLADPAFQRLVGRWLRYALDVHDRPPVRVGVLGTTDSAVAHAAAARTTPGLELGAVTESAAGPSIAGPDAGAWVRRYTTPTELVADPDLGLIAVCTRSNTRAEWGMRALEAGKHVVIEAPHSLSTHDADELTTLAAERELTVSTMPGPGEIPAYRAAAAAVRRGAVGTVFWIEVAATSFRRPEGTWHDDTRLSGGQLFDRGAAPVGWLLGLTDGPVEWVSATSRKHAWHDVTNADHSRILLRCADGTEAQITLSDVEAYPRPAFCIQGTEGTLVGPPTPGAGTAAGPLGDPGGGGGAGGADGPAGMMLYRADGVVARLPVPVSSGRSGDGHRALADHLVSGWPLPASATEARAVISVLEAAARSAATNGASTVPE